MVKMFKIITCNLFSKSQRIHKNIFYIRKFFSKFNQLNQTKNTRNDEKEVAVKWGTARIIKRQLDY